MYVRVKKISGRRYVYLVEGERRKGKVVQRTRSYLGPLPTIAAGISPRTKKRVESNIQRKLDWDSIAKRVREIPLNFDELNDMKRSQYSLSLKFRNIRLSAAKPVSAFPKNIFRERTPGELEALAKLSAAGFKRTFERIGEREYRMRL